MSDQTRTDDSHNVIDLASRAALAARGAAGGFTLAELTGARINDIFEAAFIDSRVDDEGDCVLRDDLTMFITTDAPRHVLRFFAFFTVSATWSQVVDFCNRFNDQLIVARAAVRPQPNSEGEWVVVFDHDRVMLEDERIEPKAIVKLARRFQQIVRSGIGRLDEDKLF